MSLGKKDKKMVAGRRVNQKCKFGSWFNAKLGYVSDTVTRKQLVDMRIQWEEKALTDLNLLEHKEPISAAFISRENSTWVS